MFYLNVILMIDPTSPLLRERGSHARGVFPAQDTSRIRTARATQ